MYDQPLIVYREYIQNAVDSLEEAVRQNLIAPLSMRIDIRINQEDRNIVITDNGIGISLQEASHVLLSVGASSKRHELTRGFRGIGRLGGLSYCNKLIFETSAINEKKATKVLFDCSLLKELLRPGNSDHLSMHEVIDAVTTITQYDIPSEEHFFRVTMEQVDDTLGLLNFSEVYEYLSQTAPVTFDPKFFLGKKIKQHLAEENITLTEFPIFLDSGNGYLKPIYKANKRHYTAGRPETNVDVYDVQFFEACNPEGEILAVGWYAVTDWPGTIHDDSIRGLRLRKGNIQIGDEDTLKSLFKQSRFNGWVQGDIHILSDDLIPNARRDHFEQNKSYYHLLNSLSEGIGTEISMQISEASRTRNDPVKKTLATSQKVITESTEAIESGFNSKVERENTKDIVINTIESLLSLKSKKPSFEDDKRATIQELEQILDEVENGDTYKLDAVKGCVSRKERRLLQIVTDILTEYLDKVLLDQIVSDIIDAIKSNCKGDL